MKRFWILSAILTLVILSGCTTVPITKLPDKNALKSVLPNMVLSSKTTFSKSSLTIGETLEIQSEIQYEGDETQIMGVPGIIIWNPNNNQSATSWYLDEQNNFIEYGASLPYYQIIKGKKYVIKATWDLKYSGTNQSVPSGEYTVQVTILIPNSGNSNMLLTDEMLPKIKITNNSPEQVTEHPTVIRTGPLPTIITGQTESEIKAKTNVNKASLMTGEVLTITSEIQYTGKEASILGVPLVIILDPTGKSVGSWHLDEQGVLSSSNAHMIYYQIEKSKKYTVNINWDLTQTYPAGYVPSGKYSVRATIATPTANGFSLLTTNETSIFITITNDNSQPPQTIQPSVTTLPPLPVFDVSVKAVLNKTTLTAGDSLTIQAEMTYVGGEASVNGLPAILIISSSGTVATWYLGKDGNLLTTSSPSFSYQLDKGKKYTMNINWNLNDLVSKSPIPLGQYTLEMTIVQPTTTTLTLLKADQGYFFFTIK